MFHTIVSKVVFMFSTVAAVAGVHNTQEIETVIAVSSTHVV